jgi:hypothetical protein
MRKFGDDDGMNLETKKKKGMSRHHGKRLKLHEKVSKVLLRKEVNLTKMKKLKNREREYKLLYFLISFNFTLFVVVGV